MERVKSFVVYRGGKYYIDKDTLTLDGNENIYDNRIDEIAEIQGLLLN